MYLFYYKFHGKVKDKEHLKLRYLVQVGPGKHYSATCISYYIYELL